MLTGNKEWNRLHFRIFAIAILCLILQACTATDPDSTVANQAVDNTWSVNIEISGGFAGVHQNLTVNSSRQVKVEDHRTGKSSTFVAPESEVVEIGKLVETFVRSDTARSGTKKTTQCADCFEYRIQVESKEVTRTAQLSGFPQNNSIEWQLVQMVAPYLKELAPNRKK